MTSLVISELAMPTVRPAIYAASLTDYNNGLLHGCWIDATLPPAHIEAAVAAMLAGSPTTRATGEPADEWAILDFEGFDGHVDPHEPIDVLSTRARAKRGE